MTNPKRFDHYTQARKLPVRITLVGALVLIITVWNALRLWAAISWYSSLSHYAPYPGPAYIAVTGCVFASLGVAVIWAGWRRWVFSPLLALGSAWAYTIWTWADRILVRSQVLTGRAFDAVISAILLGYVTAVALDRRNAAYFGREANERTLKD